MVSQYLLHLIDHYLMKSDTSEKKNNVLLVIYTLEYFKYNWENRKNRKIL